MGFFYFWDNIQSLKLKSYAVKLKAKKEKTKTQRSGFRFRISAKKNKQKDQCQFTDFAFWCSDWFYRMSSEYPPPPPPPPKLRIVLSNNFSGTYIAFISTLSSLAGTDFLSLNSLPQHLIQTELQTIKARWFGTYQKIHRLHA